MDDQLRQALNEKLEGLRPRDLLPHFDALDTWAAIETRLDTGTPARRGIPLWTYAAAAGLAGILIGGLAGRFFESGQAASPLAVVRPRADSATGNAIAANAVPVRIKGIPPIQVPTKVPPVRRRIAAAQPAPIVARLQPQPGASLPVPVQAVQPAAVAVASQVRRKPRAQHVLDIDAQSRTAVLNDVPVTPEKRDLLEVITVRTMPEPGARNAPSSILRHP